MIKANIFIPSYKRGTDAPIFKYLGDVNYMEEYSFHVVCYEFEVEKYLPLKERGFHLHILPEKIGIIAKRNYIIETAWFMAVNTPVTMMLDDDIFGFFNLEKDESKSYHRMKSVPANPITWLDTLVYACTIMDTPLISPQALASAWSTDLDKNMYGTGNCIQFYVFNNKYLHLIEFDENSGWEDYDLNVKLFLDGYIPKRILALVYGVEPMSLTKSANGSMENGEHNSNLFMKKWGHLNIAKRRLTKKGQFKNVRVNWRRCKKLAINPDCRFTDDYSKKGDWE